MLVKALGFLGKSGPGKIHEVILVYSTHRDGELHVHLLSVNEVKSV